MSGGYNPGKLLAMSVLAAALGWWVGSPTTIGPNVVSPAGRDTWQLAVGPARSDKAQQLLAVENAPYWGAQPATGPASVARASGPAPDTSWRISGVVGRDTSRRVLIAFPASTGKPPVLLKTGDRLPSGHVISKISEKSLCVEIGKKSFELGLERVGSGP